MLYGVRSCFGLEIFCCSHVLASCVIMGNLQGSQLNTDQIAAAVGASVAAALGAMQQQAPAQAVPPAQVQHPPVPFPPPPLRRQVILGPVGESHFLHPCRFCGHTSYWREGVCLSEWCRASWLHLVFFWLRFLCAVHSDWLLQHGHGPEQCPALGSLESYRSNVEWARSKRRKVNKGILSNSTCRSEEACVVSFFCKY